MAYLRQTLIAAVWTTLVIVGDRSGDANYDSKAYCVIKYRGADGSFLHLIILTIIIPLL